MRKILLAACGMAIGLGFAPAQAQTLQMTDAPTAQTTWAAPGRGISKAQVAARYGAPAEKLAAVGNPPISRWVYPTFTVYFEYDHVVHAVATPASR